MRSLQRSLSLGLAAILLLAGLLALNGSLLLFDSGLRRFQQDSLQDEAESLLAALQGGGAGLQLDELRVHPAYQRPHSGRYYRIDLPTGSLRSRSLWDVELPVPAQAGLAAGLHDGVAQQHWLLYRADYRRGGVAVVVTVAQDYTPVLHSLERIRWLGGLFGVLILALVLLLQWWGIRRALAPLDRVRVQIARLQEGQLSSLDQQVPQELLPLVAQVNHLLRHTGDTLRRSRDALGNLGHALKTPLAVLVSLTRRREIAGHPALQASLQEQLEQIQQRIARELGRARLAGEALPGAHFDCSEELPALCTTLGHIHPHIDIGWQAPDGLRLPWDREDLLELLGNLLDNACKWADSRVLVSAGREGSVCWLQVEDDGPGIAPERREQVLGRGQRLDEQVSGHGLGLAIVRDIATACGGRLLLGESPGLGGLQVRVELALRGEG